MILSWGEERELRRELGVEEEGGWLVGDERGDVKVCV